MIVRFCAIIQIVPYVENEGNIAQQVEKDKRNIY